ncbi:MAG: maleylpyruvate isomerase family mycothiol-dependent enzyme [Acidimicrobiia bacterium]|nr:maleylpyruvate isomerase family mycothiol-dependent enzyme [Acidimicrobiia bacterium]
MREILSDLVAEQQAIDQFLQTIDFRKWNTHTSAVGWDIRDLVSHLAHIEDYAYNALAEDGSKLGDAATYPTIDHFNQVGVEHGRTMRVQDTLEWWRNSRARVVEQLSKLKGDERIPWFAGPMSARSFASARLMETWAHGLDAHRAVGSEPEDTLRLYHIAKLAYNSLPYSFKLTGEEYSGDLRIELNAPEYKRWTFGPDDATNVITGTAGEFCRVAVQREKAANTNLEAEGELAQTALRIIRCYI